MWNREGNKGSDFIARFLLHGMKRAEINEKSRLGGRFSVTIRILIDL
jgi:hypothetical protein